MGVSYERRLVGVRLMRKVDVRKVSSQFLRGVEA
jgi:hypothetical protein